MAGADVEGGLDFVGFGACLLVFENLVGCLDLGSLVGSGPLDMDLDGLTMGWDLGEGGSSTAGTGCDAMRVLRRFGAEAVVGCSAARFLGAILRGRKRAIRSCGMLVVLMMMMMDRVYGSVHGARHMRIR